MTPQKAISIIVVLFIVSSVAQQYTIHVLHEQIRQLTIDCAK